MAHALQRHAKNHPEQQTLLTETQIEDFAQAVYLRLIKEDRAALKNFKGDFDNSIFQYLLIIAINVVRDYYRESRAIKRPQIVCSLEDLLDKHSEVFIFKEVEALQSDATTNVWSQHRSRCGAYKPSRHTCGNDRVPTIAR